MSDWVGAIRRLITIGLVLIGLYTILKFIFMTVFALMVFNGVFS